MKKTSGFVVTTIVAAVIFICLPASHLYAQSHYEVDKSKDTVHVPYQPPDESNNEQETETILLPTWPIKVPVRVPKKKKKENE